MKLADLSAAYTCLQYKHAWGECFFKALSTAPAGNARSLGIWVFRDRCRSPTPLFKEKLHGISCGSSWRRTLEVSCLPKLGAFNAATLLFSDGQSTLRATECLLRVCTARYVVGGPTMLHTDAAFIERSAGTKHS